jgi:hypothetical protein
MRQAFFVSKDGGKTWEHRSTLPDENTYLLCLLASSVCASQRIMALIVTDDLGYGDLGLQQKTVDLRQVT